MKCPKCHYLSFDPEPRCRNCGFSLGLEAPDLLMAKESPADGPLVDLELRSSATRTPQPEPVSMRASEPGEVTPAVTLPPTPAAAPQTPKPVRRIAVPRLDRPRTRLEPSERESPAAAPPAPPPQSVRVPPPPTTELPLFVKGLSDSALKSPAHDEPEPARESAPLIFEPETVEPVIVPAAIAAPAAAVAAAAPSAARVPEPEPAPIPIAPVPVVSTAEWAADAKNPPMWSGTRRRIGPLDRDLLNDLERIEKGEKKQAREKALAARLPDAAGAGRRLIAAIVDGLLLAGILVGLLALTLRWTAIEWANLPELPIWPTAAFLTLVAAGYLLLFTAFAGQTPGKMLAGIRVVGAGTNGDGSEPLSAGQVCLRELVAVPAVLLLGLGFLPALVGNERGVHDRIASTRVVRG